MNYTEITVGITDSVKLAPYEYAKPEVRLTVQLEEDDVPKEVVSILTRQAKAELKEISTKLQEDYNA